MSRTHIDNISPKLQRFDGIYRGVVEDNLDPLKMGRVRVRILGIHQDDKDEKSETGLKTVNLPWADPCYGLIEGSVSGYGCFSVPLKGSHVFLFFESGNWNMPRYFGTSPGIPITGPDTSKGFNDPSGIYPESDKLNEPDTNRLFRNDKITETIVQLKNDNRKLDIQSVITDTIGDLGSTTWDEPISTYNTEYPNNIVLATHKNIILELDNTENNKRVHIYHPSGSYVEIDNDGNLIVKSNKDKYDVSDGDKYSTCNEYRSNIQANKKEYIINDRISEIGGDDNVTNSTMTENTDSTRTTNAAVWNISTDTVEISSTQLTDVNSSVQVSISVGGNIVSITSAGIVITGPVTVNGTSLIFNPTLDTHGGWTSSL